MKTLHVACAIALGLALVAGTPLALAEPAHASAANTVVTNVQPATTPVPGYSGNIPCAQRVMADWTRVTTRPDAIQACNTAGAQTHLADLPRATALADPPTAATTAGTQRAMADWTRLAARPDATTADNAAGN